MDGWELHNFGDDAEQEKFVFTGDARRSQAGNLASPKIFPKCSADFRAGCFTCCCILPEKLSPTAAMHQVLYIQCWSNVWK